jgi:hypothetical protein
VALSRFAGVNLGAIVVEDEKAERRGKVATAIAVDGNEKI